MREQRGRRASDGGKRERRRDSEAQQEDPCQRGRQRERDGVRRRELRKREHERGSVRQRGRGGGRAERGRVRGGERKAEREDRTQSAEGEREAGRARQMEGSKQRQRRSETGKESVRQRQRAREKVEEIEILQRKQKWNDQDTSVRTTSGRGRVWGPFIIPLRSYGASSGLSCQTNL